ncbi:MAG: CpaF family protein [Thermoflexales bacterium]|nr:CpaF family protein [Thermoflexales bacterium]
MNEKDLQKALGALAPLYADPTVTEICVDAYDRVYVDRGEKLEDVASPFTSAEALSGVIEAVLALGDVALGPDKTSGEVLFPDGSRFLAVVPPTAISGPCFVLRKLTRQLTWDQVFERGAVSREAYELLKSALDSRVNVLLAGGTGSGKTTLTALLIESIPAGERVIVAEPIYEVHVRHQRSIHLAGRGLVDVPFEEILFTAARMRPDWLVVGELCGGEAAFALQIFGQGHTGLANMHATSVEDALARLEAMCLMANLGLGLGEIRRLIASAFQLVTYQQRLSDGRRRLTHIVELRGVENERYVLQPLFRYNPAEDQIEATGVQPSWEKQAE